MKLLAANRKKGDMKKTGKRPKDFTPAEELALSSNQGRPIMDGVQGGICSDPGGSSSATQPYVQGMFQVVFMTMLIQQLFMNIVGVKCITVLCSDRKYSGVAATTTHCRPTVPYRGNGETNSDTPVCMPYVVAEYRPGRPNRPGSLR